MFGAPRDGLEAQGRAVRSSQRTQRCSARLLLPSAGRLFVCPFILHVMQLACAPHVHLFAATPDARARVSFACQLTTASSQPAGWVTVAVAAFPGPVSTVTRALQDPGCGVSMLGQQHGDKLPCYAHVSAPPGTNREGYRVTEERKSDKLGVI